MHGHQHRQIKKVHEEEMPIRGHVEELVKGVRGSRNMKVEPELMEEGFLEQ